PPLAVDADLRPEGRSGPLVRTLASYEKYYARWSAVWESQALLRADPAVGDPELCAAFTAMIDPLRWPAAGVSERDVVQIGRIKAGVEAERLARGANPATEVNLGRGGRPDVEWTVELVETQRAHVIQEVRRTQTLTAWRARVDDGAIAGDAAPLLVDSWRLVSCIRNAVMLWRSRRAESMDEAARD